MARVTKKDVEDRDATIEAQRVEIENLRQQTAEQGEQAQSSLLTILGELADTYQALNESQGEVAASNAEFLDLEEELDASRQDTLFLYNTLVTIQSYGGNDPDVVHNLAVAATSSFEEMQSEPHTTSFTLDGQGHLTEFGPHDLDRLLGLDQGSQCDCDCDCKNQS